MDDFEEMDHHVQTIVGVSMLKDYKFFNRPTLLCMTRMTVHTIATIGAELAT